MRAFVLRLAVADHLIKMELRRKLPEHGEAQFHPRWKRRTGRRPLRISQSVRRNHNLAMSPGTLVLRLASAPALPLPIPFARRS